MLIVVKKNQNIYTFNLCELCFVSTIYPKNMK